MSPRKTTKFTVFLWHRRVGLAAIVLVVILAVTGIMLNHTDELELDKTYIGNSWLLDWYGIEPEDEPVSYRVKDHIISAWQNQLFFDNRFITMLQQNVHGAVAAEQFIVVALDNEIILLSDEGEFVERVSTSISFSNIQRLGMKYSRPVIETSDPLYYIADEHILDWDVIINEGIEWTAPYQLKDAEYQKLLIAYRGQGLKLERVILDLHSGRIFGKYGNLLMDAAALALLWLSFSGLWVWYSRRQKIKQKKHYRKHHRIS
jgi:hypothetical protein